MWNRKLVAISSLFSDAPACANVWCAFAVAFPDTFHLCVLFGLV